MKIALCQINTTVGDLKGNKEKIVGIIEEIEKISPHIVVFPELALPGYPPEDLILNATFIKEEIKTFYEILEKTRGKKFFVILGLIWKEDDVYNSAAVIFDGKFDIYKKIHLPNYGVFDEKRYFQSGKDIKVYRMGNTIFGVNICEDIWYPGDPVYSQTVYGDAELIINISSSPYHILKPRQREDMIRIRARDYSTYVAFCNLVGGQDELVFDGSSSIIGPDGETIIRAPMFEEAILFKDIPIEKVFSRRILDPRRREEKTRKIEQVFSVDGVDGEAAKIDRIDSIFGIPVRSSSSDFLGVEEEIFRALKLATRDYVRKNGFSKVIVALSGGIDSSLVVAIAVEALGRENVMALYMPSYFSSKESEEDARELCKNLGVELKIVPISQIFDTYLSELKFEDFSVAEENLQSRIRGNIVMAFSNKFGYLVLSTGNKSEISMGYCTLYGDTAGGFAVIKDLYKTMVYRIAEYYNEMKGKEIIPKRVFTKPPSAELRPNQKDEDTLPPYRVLDRVLEIYIEENETPERISEILRVDLSLVRNIINTVDRNEYKRRQMPPGPKLTERAFGKDRRYPITSKFRV